MQIVIASYLQTIQAQSENRRNMSKRDEVSSANERHWEKMVKEGCGFTRPWLNLDKAVLRHYAKGKLHTVPEPLDEVYPPGILADVEGKDVLCLASGGGQQSAVFGLLDARVTVVDLAEGQLDGDRKAAAHYGYEVTTIRGDMRDLSPLDDESFDLVYQAPSMSYVPDVRQVYAEVAVVLRPGGLYRVSVTNPATEFVGMDSWDGHGYRITVPYTVRRTENGEEDPIEFRHHWSDIFNGLIDNGFSIQQVQEAPEHLKQYPEARPGSWKHILTYVQWHLAIVARKG
jgi:SAM-dependent methyltransferase